MNEASRRAGRSGYIAGFTLLELLVVIAVIAVLAVLGFSSFHSMIESAHKAKSVSNLRALAQAALLHAGDHNGFLPACIHANYPFHFYTLDKKIGSFNAMAKYLPEGDYAVFCNPALLARLRCTPEESLFTEKGYWGASYWYFGGNPKGYYNAADPTIGTPVWEGSPEKLNAPRRSLLIGDLSYHERSTANLPMRPGCHVKMDKDNKLVTTGGNWAFLDGSVQWFSRAELTVEQPCGGQWLLRPAIPQ